MELREGRWNFGTLQVQVKLRQAAGYGEAAEVGALLRRPGAAQFINGADGVRCYFHTMSYHVLVLSCIVCFHTHLSAPVFITHTTGVAR